MKIFIGSSSESKQHAEWLAALVEDSGHTAVPWYLPGVFRPGDHTLASLERVVSEVDAAALVFAEDDLIWYRGGISSQPRDNVLIEYGLFCGLLSANRVAICKVGKPHQSSDLAGVAYLDITPERRNRASLEIKRWLEDLNSASREASDLHRVLSIFEHVNRGEFLLEAESLLGKASQVTMMGSGLSILAHNPIVMTLLKRAALGTCRVELLFADPYSPSVQDRLVEEELGDVRPQDRKVGLLGRVDMILSAWDLAGRPNNFIVGFLRNYPTFALMCIDNTYYVYPYAYATLGTFSPVLKFSKAVPYHAPMIEFLDSHRHRSLESAIEATTALRVLRDKQPFHETGHSLAVFIVPAAGSMLYDFGSDILGYDIRADTVRPAKYSQEVGEAAQYGIHLTVCDAMYFFNAADLNRAIAEVEFWAGEIGAFELTNLSVQRCFPSYRSISITAADPSGRLEILHSELIHGVYRRAAASDYTCGRGYQKPDENLERRRNMVSHFGAPHILGKYAPHFTLLTDVSAAEMDHRREELEKLFRQQVRPRKLMVRNLAIMSRSNVSGRWTIAREIRLSGD